DSRLDQFPDQAEHAAVAYALLNHLDELFPNDGIEVCPDIYLQDPSRGPGTGDPSHFVQSLMLPASGPKPVRALEKILLIDGVQQVHRTFLHELVLEGGNRDWPLFPIFLGDVNSAQWLGPIFAF